MKVKPWEIYKLSDVAEVNPKLPNRESVSGDLEVQFIPMKLVEERVNKIHLTETRLHKEVEKGSYTPFINGDILFAKVTPCMENGKVAVADNLRNGIGYGSSEFHVVRPKAEILNRYLFYFLVQDKFRSEAEYAMTGAVGLRRVPKQFVENYLIPVPSIALQQAIVSKIEELFSELDKGIENLRMAQQQLKTYRQSVLKWAFEGKLTNVSVDVPWNGLEQLSMAAEEQQEYGSKLPKGWRWVKLGDIAEKVTDGEHATPRRTNEGILLLSARNIQNGFLDLNNVDYIPEDEYLRIIKRCNPEHGDILISCSGSIGRIALVPRDLKFTMVRSVALVKFNRKLYSAKYFEYLLQSPLLQKQIEKGKKATAQANLFIGPIKNLDVIECSYQEQIKVVETIESRLSVADKMDESINQSLQQAETLRQSILKKAFEGKLI